MSRFSCNTPSIFESNESATLVFDVWYPGGTLVPVQILDLVFVLDEIGIPGFAHICAGFPNQPMSGGNLWERNSKHNACFAFVTWGIACRYTNLPLSLSHILTHIISTQIIIHVQTYSYQISRHIGSALTSENIFDILSLYRSIRIWHTFTRCYLGSVVDARAFCQ